MANTIEIISQFSPVIDEIYKRESLTARFDGEGAEEGANAGEFKIPKVEAPKMGKYDKVDGYYKGDAKYEFETVVANYNRSTSFSIDAIDNIDTLGRAFGSISGEVMRTALIPELDAFRFSLYGRNAGSTTTTVVTDATSAMQAIVEVMTAMDDAEVPAEGRILFAQPSVIRGIQALDTTKSREVLASFSEIISVPAGRFFKYVIPDPDGSMNYDGGHFAFQIIHPSALVQFTKRVAPKIITPEANQNADAWFYGLRYVAVQKPKDNKKAGIGVAYANDATA